MYMKFLLVFFLLSPGALLAQSALTESEIEGLLKVKIRLAKHMSYSPDIIDAVKNQNSVSIAMSDIKKRDELWTGDSNDSIELKRSITDNNIAQYLKRRVQNNDSIDEVFITDNQGANVAAYPATSDYWQGDEEKWTASFNNGEGKVFIGPLEEDQSTNTAQVQISVPIFDQQQTIGVLVMGVSVDYLNR
ncbi:MAG: PDC sensor domain-containing protein [Gammaproteobacteria bacterium]|nr:PDC sensor domain-containing protein [Gammaproteobacteria bacterium]